MKLSQYKILLLEDDEMIASGLKWALERKGYFVKHCASVKAAYKAIDEQIFDLAILDIQLPDGLGFDVQEALGTDVAVIFLAIAHDGTTTVRALRLGAVDCLTKSLDFHELLHCVKGNLPFTSCAGRVAEIEKASTDDNPGIIAINGLIFDTVSGRVHINDEPISLSAREYRLLEFLVSNRGVLLSRAKIIDSVWQDSNSYIEDNTLSTYVKYVREKTCGEVEIETVRGLGYRVN
ncbi:MAG: response regulator transcription factor [Coriobacteriia bacterium]|nr:response regulator transcription factor [Coriobacteriia bacterium]